MWPFKKRPKAEPEFLKFLGDPEAERLEKALLKRDWETSRAILTAASPEERSYYLIVAANAAGVEEWITGAIRDEPDSTLPLLVRGARLVHWAWEARGEGMSDTVSEDAWKLWFQRLRQAEDCLDEVVERTPEDADAWEHLITLGRARQLPQEERWRRFNKLIEINPTHFYGHTQMLNGLMRKWSGSDEAMFDFARTRAAAFPGTHIPVLVAMAHIERARAGSKVIADLQRYLRQSEVAGEIWDASQNSVFHYDYQETLLTPVVWNNFAFALALSDQDNAAGSLFDVIGDDWITESPWGSVRRYTVVREHVQGFRDDD